MVFEIWIGIFKCLAGVPCQKLPPLFDFAKNGCGVRNKREKQNNQRRYRSFFRGYREVHRWDWSQHGSLLSAQCHREVYDEETVGSFVVALSLDTVVEEVDHGVIWWADKCNCSKFLTVVFHWLAERTSASVTYVFANHKIWIMNSNHGF